MALKQIVDWLRSYVRNRNQICSVNGKISREREVRCGEPQGSTVWNDGSSTNPLVPFSTKESGTCKTNFLKRSFSYRAAQGWNELSTENIDEISL